MLSNVRIELWTRHDGGVIAYVYDVWTDDAGYRWRGKNAVCCALSRSGTAAPEVLQAAAYGFARRVIDALDISGDNFAVRRAAREVWATPDREPHIMLRKAAVYHGRAPAPDVVVVDAADG